jgi:simple sugar transport system substrate-binding protein
MARLRRNLAVVATVATSAVVLAACGGGSNSSTHTTTTTAGTAAGTCPYRFAVITHGGNNYFWSVVYKGAKNAAHDLGCQLTEVYGSQQQGQAEPDDNAENAQIQDAINAHVDGIAVTDHAPGLMNPTLASAHARGIPVVLFNAGCDNQDIAASQAMTCVGQPEQLAGEAAGQRFAKLGANNALCIIDQTGQNYLDRCNGLAQALGVGPRCSTHAAPANGPACTELVLSTPNAGANPQQAVVQVSAYLQAHPQVNAVLALTPTIGTAIVDTHPANKPKIATFDLSSTVESDIKAGSMMFAVDQQQYLQGYLPVVFLYLYKKHEGNSVGGGTTVASGPLIIDNTNINNVTAAIAAGDN